MWLVINSSALIGGKFILKKNALQDLLSSLNAVISTNERIEFITGHVIFNKAYNEILQLKTTMDLSIKILISNLCQNILWMSPRFELSATSLLAWYVTFWLSFHLHILHWERAAIHVYSSILRRHVGVFKVF